MTASRRDFIAAGAAGLCGGLAVGATSMKTDTATARAADKPADPPRCLDYGLSFICGTAAHNSVRFWVESRTTIFDDKAGTTTEYLQCASCKSEDTFAKQDLFYKDNYDFLTILGDGRWLIFRRPARLNPNYRQIRNEADVWGVMNKKLPKASSVTTLATLGPNRHRVLLPVVRHPDGHPARRSALRQHPQGQLQTLGYQDAADRPLTLRLQISLAAH